jgi:lysine 2,3-aminomutase
MVAVRLPPDPDRWRALPGWNDWRWQMRNRISRPAEIEALLPDLTADERAGLRAVGELFRVGITPYYFALADRQHPSCPIRQQILPLGQETHRAPGEYEDPLGEDARSPAPGLVHRYPDRVLLLCTTRCAVYCRHCNRRRMVGGETEFSREDLGPALEYIRQHREIRDVLLSGGDPLGVATERLEWVVRSVREIRHVDIIRIGTRVPVCLPMRVDDELCTMLRRYHPLYVNTHFNHPKEVTAEARAACERLADAGIPLGNQAVLLRGINSSLRCIRALMRELLKARVRPYYLFQGDPALGTDHLRTPVACGVEIMEGLRGHVSGMAIPHLVIDAPSGGGKLPFGPSYILSQGPDRLLVRNYRNEVFEYTEPANRDCTVPYDAIFFARPEDD